MKIVHWDEMFHPNFGYQINVLPVFQKKMGHDVIVLTSDHIEEHPIFSSFANSINIEIADKEFEVRTGVKIIRLPIYGVYSGRVIYKPGIISSINKLKPDVIMCHTSDTLSAITITLLHKFLKAPIVFDNHMLEMASQNRFSKIFRFLYRHFVSPIMKKNKFITIRTQDDSYVIDSLGIPAELAPYISFGTDADMFSPNKEARNTYREKLGIGKDEFVVMYCGKLTEGKGALLLAEAIETRFETDKKVTFMIIGNSNNDEYGENVETLLRKSQNKVIRLGTQLYSELVNYYRVADLAVFPRQCSLSFFDVQAVGLPVVLENNNVNVGRINGNGIIFNKDDSESLRNAILKIVNMPYDDYIIMSNNSRQYIINNFDYNDIAGKYTDILFEEMNRQNTNERKNIIG